MENEVKQEVCPECNGYGYFVVADPHHGHAMQEQCENCRGTGYVDVKAQ